MTKSEKHIVDQLVAQREKAGLSQRRMSIELGYTSDVIYKIEKGIRKVDIDILCQINSKFGFEFDVKISNN